MLLKPFQQVFVPGIAGRAAQAYERDCPPTGGSSPGGGSAPAPGSRCYVVYVYGPPLPPTGGPSEGGTSGRVNIIGYYTVCV